MNKPKTYGLTHLAISVKDVNRTRLFYTDVFDMQVMYFEKGFLQMTTPGCNDIIVFEENTEKATGDTGGIAHVGFRLKDPADMGDMIKKIISGGAVIMKQGEFVPGSPFVFFRDPDGYLVEVWYELLP